jgi:radical SAM superfamily enzyme YgiQ (UPF0313 family)
MIDSVLLVRPFAAEKKEFPLGLLYVGTALQKKGFRVKIIDLQDDPTKEEEIIKILSSSPNTMLGISALAPHYRWVKNFTLKIKRLLPETQIIVGGHIAICKNVLLQNSGVDFVCVGEGEETIPELIEVINHKGSIHDVSGLAYKDEEKNVIKTAWRPLLKDFGIPNYDLIDVTRYLIHPNKDAFFARSPEYAKVSTPHDNLGVIMFSRGCVGHCGFCYRHLSGFRQMSVDQAWEHMMLMYTKYKIKYFRIDDELFTNSPEWLRAFCGKIKQSNLGILFRITGLRVDTIDDERLTLLKQAGCIGINYGIESCSQTILNNMLKMVTVKQNIDAIEKTIQHGMITMAYIIWGYVDEDETTLKETMDTLLSLALPAYLVSIFYLVALPGTTVYVHALRTKKIVDEDAYLDSLYVLMERSEGIHKIYLINYSKINVLTLRKYEEMLLLLLKIQSRLGRDSHLLKTLKGVFIKLPAQAFLPFVQALNMLLNGARSLRKSFSDFCDQLNYSRSILVISKFKSRLQNQFIIKPDVELDSVLRLTINWIKKAQDATYPGISRGFSLTLEPKFDHIGWQPPYPETTGYIIPTLIQASKLFNDSDLVRRAVAAADWEIEILLPNGAVRGGHYSQNHRSPAVFDTAQVIRGLLAVHQITNDRKYLDAAKKSADWILTNEHNREGFWLANNADCVNPKTTTYNIYAAVPIVELGLLTKNNDYIDLGRRVASYTIQHQTASGWFKEADFENREDTLLHTLAYTIDGLCDVGHLLNDANYITATRKALDRVIGKMSKDGFLPGRFLENWDTTVEWSCLTGSAQIGVSCMKAWSLTKDQRYYDAAKSVCTYILQRQNRTYEEHGGQGAVWGSWPIDGGYQPYQALNWAAKYFADLLIEIRLSENKTKLYE